MEENKQVVMPPPYKRYRQMKYLRLAKISSNMSFVFPILLITLLLGILLAPILMVAVYFILFIVVIVISVFSLGMVYLTPENPVADIFEIMGQLTNEDVFGKIMMFCKQAVPIICYAGIGLSILFLVLKIISKQKVRTVRIVFTILSLILFAITLLLYYLLIGGIANG